MSPEIGPLPAHVVGWLLALALGGGAAAWLMSRAGISDDEILASLWPRVVALFVGSKLLYLVEDWQRWWGDPSAFVAALVSAQMRIPGGLLLLVIVGPIVSRSVGIPHLFLADTIAPAAGLAIFGIRIGCFLEGCCHGRTTALPWGVEFPPHSPAASWQIEQGLRQMNDAVLAVHPLQLYFGLFGVMLFAVLTVYQRHKRYDGEVLLFFGLAYLWSTWLLEFLRATPHGTTQQTVLIAAVGISTVWAVVEARRAGNP